LTTSKFRALCSRITQNDTLCSLGFRTGRGTRAHDPSSSVSRQFVLFACVHMVRPENRKRKRVDPRAAVGQAHAHDARTEAWRDCHLFFVYERGDCGDGDSTADGKRLAAAAGQSNDGVAGTGTTHFPAGLMG